jgi:hypothetical protein
MKYTPMMSVALSFSFAACASDDGVFEEPASDGSILLDETAQALVGPRNSFRNANSRRCIGVDGASKESGAAIQQFECSASDTNQRWVVLLEDVAEPIDPETGSLFRPLVNDKSELCMGVDNGSTSPGADIRQFQCDGTLNQKWVPKPGARLQDGTPTFSFKNHDGLCIGVDGASMANGAQLKQFPCDGRANQRWIVIPR